MMVIGTGVGLFRHFSGTRDRSKDVDKVANCSFVLSSPCLIVLLNSVHFAGSRPCQISAQKTVATAYACPVAVRMQPNGRVIT
jgi:hypothetical protein